MRTRSPLGLLFAALLPALAVAQPGPSPSEPAPPAARVAAVAVDSPRASMVRFLELARARNWAEAATWLELDAAHRAGGPELARKLDAVLGRHLSIDPQKLSPQSLGDRDDGLPPHLEQLGLVPTGAGHREGVYLARVQQPDHAAWLFAASTVARIDSWYDTLDDRWLREHLPDPLLRRGPRDLLWWQWLVLPLLFLAAWTVGLLLGWLTRKGLGTLAKRTSTPWDDTVLEELRSPVVFAWALLAFSLLIRALGLAPRGTQFLHSGLKAGVLLVFFWVALRMLVVGSQVAARAHWANAAVLGALPLIVRVGKVAVFSIGGITVLSELGYPVASLIAGLGIGGLALALAAQKTVENVFGSVSIGVDQPFHVGDFVKFEDVIGTVEQLGLRSTRIRTLERTLITIPNGKLAELRIETFAARDRMRFYLVAGLVYGTTAAQLREVITGFEAVLRKHPRLHPEGMTVRLRALGTYAVEVEVNAYLDTRDWNEFTLMRQELLLQLMEVVERAGTSLAFPTQTIQVASSQ